MKSVPLIYKMDVPLMNGNTRRSSHPYNQSEFNSAYQYVAVKEPGICKKVKDNASTCTFRRLIVTLLPVLGWLPQYNWKEDLLSDMISGFTVAIMHIPQGMAYSSLAGVPPIVGIYMAFFPVLVYFFFGSSRHVSMGTFAVVCMMAGKPVMLYSTSQDTPIVNTTSSLLVQSTIPLPSYTPIQVATVVCFVVGCWQVILGVCRMGSLSVLMSDTLVSGFTTGAAFLVFTSQVKHALGIKLPRYVGPLKLIRTYVDLFTMIDRTNFLALTLTLGVVLVLFLYNTFIKPKLSTRAPVPIELIVVTIGTLVSSSLGLNKNYSVAVVGEIPTGLPMPTLPPLNLVPNVLVDGLVIAIVAFSINISMASLFARKENYKVDANQELVASGLGNLAGSFFSCLPFCASLSRSLIQHTVGGRTQLASIVSCSILALVLLFIGPFFEPLPNCVLAGIILFALKAMLLQVKDFPPAWKHSRRDGFIWLVTFLSVILVDIDVGLGVGIIVSLGSIIVMSQSPYVHILGNLPNTDIYLESDRYHTAVPVPHTLIVRICGGLHFANKNNVQKKIEKLLRSEMKEDPNNKITKLVIDLSAVIFIDPATSKSIISLQQDLKTQAITLCLSSCSGHVFENLKRCEFFNTFPEEQMFPFIRDAIAYSSAEDPENLVNQTNQQL